MGPVQVLVVGFDRPAFSGEVLAEFERLGKEGIVRLLDLLVVSRADDGGMDTLPAPHGSDDTSGELVTAVVGQPIEKAGGDGEPAVQGTNVDDTWSLADVVPPGSAAAIALIEHLWAAPLVAAIAHAGGKPLEESWLAPADRRVVERLLGERARDVV